MKVIVREVLRRVEPQAVDGGDERARMEHVTLVPSGLARARLRAAGGAGVRTPWPPLPRSG